MQDLRDHLGCSPLRIPVEFFERLVAPSDSYEQSSALPNQCSRVRLRCSTHFAASQPLAEVRQVATDAHFESAPDPSGS